MVRKFHGMLSRENNPMDRFAHMKTVPIISDIHELVVASINHMERNLTLSRVHSRPSRNSSPTYRPNHVSGSLRICRIVEV